MTMHKQQYRQYRREAQQEYREDGYVPVAASLLTKARLRYRWATFLTDKQVVELYLKYPPGRRGVSE